MREIRRDDSPPTDTEISKRDAEHIGREVVA